MSVDLKPAIVEGAYLMSISARTAPKTRGIDEVEIVLIENEKELNKLADKMEEIGKETERAFFVRDSNNVRRSQAVLLIGVKSSKPKGLNCGACGHGTCEEFEKAIKVQGRDFVGPMCAFQLIDLGIAVGSAAKTASLLNIDNRIMFSIGAAALKLGLMENSDFALGIPLSAYGKNIYFDRKM
ncbi:MAG: DUF2148 domain-containing protein [Nitrososphaeria archaeon]|nr:DUF2148 domain-containing protein [Aigarchaeota archaeon]MCX8187116.1 DUF2148 domain-containing protein [Nitrososphaeria archaeon]MDW8021453.1 DUF2148 domain-containing protein [Nitrososphaerota archaeon]